MTVWLPTRPCPNLTYPISIHIPHISPRLYPLFDPTLYPHASHSKIPVDEFIYSTYTINYILIRTKKIIYFSFSQSWRIFPTATSATSFRRTLRQELSDTWIAEICLWVPWIHCGDLVAQAAAAGRMDGRLTKRDPPKSEGSVRLAFWRSGIFRLDFFGGFLLLR